MTSILHTPRVSEPRERLLRTASELFYREGITRVGVDKIMATAGVTRATFYRHFPGKEALVLAYLASEDAALRAVVAALSDSEVDARARIDTFLEGLATDVEQHHTRGCPFINAAAEYPDPASDVRIVIAAHREWFRSELEELLANVGVQNSGQAAKELVLLRDAAMVGGYLDGWEAIRSGFVASARRAIESN